MKVPKCLDCRDTGTLGHSYLTIDPCSCPAGAPYRVAEQTQLPPLPDLLPCFNADCRSTAVHWYSSLRGAQFVICRGCGLSLSRGSQDRTYEAWNALPRVSTSDAWRPIATAPKDGTTIDVWREEGGRETVSWGFRPHDCGEMGQYCDSDWHREKKAGWVCATFGEMVGGQHNPFTHWMPLPADPSPSQSAKGEE